MKGAFARPAGNIYIPVRAPIFFVGALWVTCVIAAQFLPIQWSIAALSIAAGLPPAYVGISRLHRLGLFDPLGVFCCAFAAYNGLLPWRVGFWGLDELTLPYPVVYPLETYQKAAGLSAIAAFALVVGSVVIGRTIPKRAVPHNQHSLLINSKLYVAGLISFLIGLVMFFVGVGRSAGSYVAFLSTARAERFTGLNDSGIGLPYLAFATAGLVCALYGYFLNKSRAKKILVIGACMLWIALLFTTGDRNLAIRTILYILALRAAATGVTTRLTYKTGLLLFCAYIALVFFGHYRSMIPYLVRGEMGYSDVDYEVQNSASLTHYWPENTEFAGPYISILHASWESSDPLYGESYLISCISPFPRVLFPHKEKPAGIAWNFQNKINDLYMSNKFPMGWGFTPVAEAYLNFGAAGVFAVFLLWVVFFQYVAKLGTRPGTSLLCYVVLLPEALNLNRIDLYTGWLESAQTLGALVLTLYLARLLVSRGMSVPRRPFLSPVPATDVNRVKSPGRVFLKR